MASSRGYTHFSARTAERQPRTFRAASRELSSADGLEFLCYFAIYEPAQVII